LPRSYNIYFDKNRNQGDNRKFIKEVHDGLWILKPIREKGGNGIRIIKDLVSFKRELTQ
jgi:hypothetical protein